MPRVLILQHTEWCHWGLMNATSACTTHRHCWELILQLFCGYLQLWFIPSPHCFLLQSPVLCEARELIPETPVSLTWGFCSCKLLWSWVQKKKKKIKLTFKISILAKFCSICWDNFDLTHFSFTQATQELVRVHISHEEVNALLALSGESMLAHPTWANQERRTTRMKPPDILLDKSSLQKNNPFRWGMGGKKQNVNQLS